MFKTRCKGQEVSAANLMRWLCLAVVFSPWSQAQTVTAATLSGNNQQQSFEVASVKQIDLAKPAMGDPVGPNENGLRLVSDLSFFIELAYGVEDLHVVGLPAWTRGRFYEITAKTAVPSKPADVEAMLRTLLQDRFKLVSHFETKTEPVYSLVIDKGGLKIKAVDADVKTSYSSGFASLQGVMTTSEVARLLAASLRKTVVDNTGLSAKYPVNLRWTPDVQVEGGTDPSIFTAIQEQLGMKLESARGPIRLLVVDSVAPASDN